MLKSFLELLQGGRPDEIIWAADLEYWVTAQRLAGQLDDKYQGESGRLELARQLGVMPYYWYGDLWLQEPTYHSSVEVTVEERDEQTIKRWTTPIGSIEEIQAFLPESCCAACIKHPVHNRADLKTLLYILQHLSLEACGLDDYAQRRRLYAEYDGLPIIALPRSPLPALAVEWCGVENLVYLMMDCPDLIAEILQLFETQQEPIIDVACQAQPPLVHFCDNLTSDCYTPFFDEFMAEPYRRRLDRLHGAGVKCAVHLDGTVRGLLPKLAAVGFDAVESLTPAPVGDVEVERMRPLADNDEVILWGGMPGAMFSHPYSWPDVDSHLDRLFTAWSGQRFVLGVADQIPPDADMDICRRISEKVRQKNHEHTS